MAETYSPLREFEKSRGSFYGDFRISKNVNHDKKYIIEWHARTTKKSGIFSLMILPRRFFALIMTKCRKLGHGMALSVSFS